MADAWAEFAACKATELDTGMKSSADGFGTRAFLDNDDMARRAAAVRGIYGNSKEEAIYPAYFGDSAGQPLTGARRYASRFAEGRLPPANAFWSPTLHAPPESPL